MQLPDEPSVVVYVTRFCPYCHRATALLDKKQVAYAKVDVTFEPNAREWLLEQTGQSTVPQIFINKQSIGGCDDMYALERQGKLDALLQHTSP